MYWRFAFERKYKWINKMCKKQKDREKNTTALFPPMSKHKGVEPAVLISASKIDGGLSG